MHTIQYILIFIILFNIIYFFSKYIYLRFFIFNKRFNNLLSEDILKIEEERDILKFIKRKAPEKILDLLIILDLNINPEELLLIMIVVPIFLGIIFYILYLDIIISFLVFLFTIFIFIYLLKNKKRKELEKFNVQLGDALLIISNSLKSGFTFEQALRNIQKDLPNPIGREFKQIVNHVDLGMSLEESINKVVIRMESEDLDLVNTALSIHNQIGGDFAEVLATSSQTIRKRIIMRKNIKAMTSQGRLSAKVIGFVPVLIVVIMLIVNPEYIIPLFTTDYGKTILLISVILQAIGFFVINKIVDIKI